MRINSFVHSGGRGRNGIPESGPMEESILDAVERVISRRGVSGTTLEAMAAEAGFSKGGLLHYFPNKQAILFRLLDRMTQRLDKARENKLAGPNSGRYGKLKATISSFIEMISEDRYGMHNVAELLSDSGIRAHVASTRVNLFQELSAGSKRPERVAQAMLVAEGLWFDSFLEESAFPMDVRARMLARFGHYLDLLEKDFVPQVDEAKQQKTAEGA